MRMPNIKYTANDHQLMAENGGVLPNLPRQQSPPPATVAIAIEQIHRQRALHHPSRPPSFLTGENPNTEFRAEESGVISAWTKIHNPKTGDTELVSIIETAYESYHSRDPKERFAAYVLAAETSMLRGIKSGAPEAETEIMRDLCRFLHELAEGNYSDATLPKKRPVGKSSITAMAYAAFVCVVEYRKKRDGCSRQKAACWVLRDLDKVLKPRQICIADWLQGGAKAVADQEEHTHGHAAGVARW
jgi:hypothetical protein